MEKQDIRSAGSDIIKGFLELLLNTLIGLVVLVMGIGCFLGLFCFFIRVMDSELLAWLVSPVISLSCMITCGVKVVGYFSKDTYDPDKYSGSSASNEEPSEAERRYWRRIEDDRKHEELVNLQKEQNKISKQRIDIEKERLKIEESRVVKWFEKGWCD